MKPGDVVKVPVLSKEMSYDSGMPEIIQRIHTMEVQVVKVNDDETVDIVSSDVIGDTNCFTMTPSTLWQLSRR